MTISPSTASAESLADAPQAEEHAPDRATGAPGETDVPPTLASRFIILALCLAVVLSTLAFGTVHSWTLGLFYLGAVFMLLAWMADAWRTRRLRISLNFLQLPLVGIILLGLVQLLPLGASEAGSALASDLHAEPVRSLSLDPYTTRFVLIQFVSLLIYFAAALAFVDSPRRLRTLVRTLIIFGFLLAVFGIIQFFVSPERIFGLRETRQSLAFGPFINRHHFAGCMEMALALPLGLLLSGAIEREKYIIYGFAAGLMGIAVILTNSRGGMLSLVAEVMFLVIVSGLARRRSEREGKRESRVRTVALRAGLGVGLLAVLFTGVLFFGGEEALNRLVGTANAEDPTTGRLHFWRGTVDIIREHPLLGTGLGAFSLAYTRYDTSNGRLYRLEQAHNDYLQTLSDAGIVGALLGVVFLVALFRMAFRRMQSESTFRRGTALGALAGCFGVLVHSFFDFPLHTTSNALLFLVMAALATVNGRVEPPSRRPHRRRRRRRHASSTETSQTTPTGEDVVESAPAAALQTGE